MITRKKIVITSISAGIVLVMSFVPLAEKWQSKFVSFNNGSLSYTPDPAGNIIPDFSAVGFYHGDKDIPNIAVVKTVNAINDDCTQLIQSAIDEVAKRNPGADGYRGTVLLKKGTYKMDQRPAYGPDCGKRRYAAMEGQ